VREFAEQFILGGAKNGVIYNILTYSVLGINEVIS
jgi:hypothetical protein